MPFVGLDWRSPGDHWIKTESGRWEQMRLWRIKMFDHLNESTMRRMIRNSLSACVEPTSRQPMGESHNHQSIRQPHALVKRTTTRESLVTTSIGDVFARLDMDGGLKDLRRFRYITKIVSVLITDRLHQLSGRTQLLLVQLARQAAEQALASDMYTSVARQLATGLRRALTDHRYEHIGSDELWRRHWDSLAELERLLDGDGSGDGGGGGGSEVSAEGDNTRSPFAANPFDAMPSDCIRQVLGRLEDPADIERLAGLDRRVAGIASEDLLWKRLVLFHFSGARGLAGRGPAVTSVDDCNWPAVYRQLFRRYGNSRQVYPVVLHLCLRCSCLFWPNLGHPCNVVSHSDPDPAAAADPAVNGGAAGSPPQPQPPSDSETGATQHPSKPISPEEFVRFFF